MYLRIYIRVTMVMQYLANGLQDGAVGLLNSNSTNTGSELLLDSQE